MLPDLADELCLLGQVRRAILRVLHVLQQRAKAELSRTVKSEVGRDLQNVTKTSGANDAIF
jgi:hypothetical protein